MSWWTIDGEDLNATGEVEIWGDFARRGVNEVLMKGCGKVETPYVCEDPDDCTWPGTLLITLYDIAYEYKAIQRGRPHIRRREHREPHRFSDPKNRHVVYISDADVDEIVQGDEVLRRRQETKARLQIEKSEGKLLIEC